MMKKVLNVNFSKSQQSMIDVRFLNVHALFLDTCSSEILNSEKEIKKKDLIFVKIDAVWQQKTKSEFSSVIMFNLKNKIIKKCLQYHVKLLFMKSAKEDFYQETCHITESIIVKKKLMNINMKDISSIFSEIHCILKLFMQTLNALFITTWNAAQLSACMKLAKHMINQMILQMIWTKLKAVNLMLMKKLFNIAATLSEMMTVESVKLHFWSVEEVKKILFIMKCSWVASIINKICIDILLDFKSQINLIEQLIAKQCDFSIQCRVILKMQNVNVNSFKMIDYMKCVKVEMIKISASVILFMKNDCDNDLLLNCSWKHTVQAGKQQQVNGLTEWNIWNAEKKVSFINTPAQTESLISMLMIFEKKLN